MGLSEFWTKDIKLQVAALQCFPEYGTIKCVFLTYLIAHILLVS